MSPDEERLAGRHTRIVTDLEPHADYDDAHQVLGLAGQGFYKMRISPQRLESPSAVGAGPVGTVVRHLRHALEVGVAGPYCGRPVGR
jgi:hypothetical protein